MTIQQKQPEWETVPDNAARALASNRAAAFGEQANAVNRQIGAITMAAKSLEAAVNGTNSLFRSLQAAIEDADSHYASRLSHAADSLKTYSNWMRGVNSGFSEFIPAGGGGALITALQGFSPYAERLELPLRAEDSLIKAIRESGISFPSDWSERDMHIFARRYFAEMERIQLHIDRSFSTTDFRVDADVAQAAQTEYLFLSDVSLALHLTLDQRLDVKDLYLDSGRMLTPVIDYLTHLSFSDYRDTWNPLGMSEAGELALKISNAHTAAEGGTSYHDWYTFPAAGSNHPLN